MKAGNFPTGSSDSPSNLEFMKDEEKEIPCTSSLLKPAKQIMFAPLTGQQIADFFSLRLRRKTFQDSPFGGGGGGGYEK